MYLIASINNTVAVFFGSFVLSYGIQVSTTASIDGNFVLSYDSLRVVNMSLLGASWTIKSLCVSYLSLVHGNSGYLP